MTEELSPRDNRMNQRIIAAMKILEPRPGAFVRLVQLRGELMEISPEALDLHLRRMSRQRSLHLVPDSNRKTLGEADRRAAVVIGDEPNHLVARGESTFGQ